MDIQQQLIEAIAIMDEKGRGNPENNSTMLWNEYWDALRRILAECATAPTVRKQVEVATGYWVECVVVPLVGADEFHKGMAEAHEYVGLKYEPKE